MVDEQKKTARKNLQTFIVIEINVEFKKYVYIRFIWYSYILKIRTCEYINIYIFSIQAYFKCVLITRIY